MEYQEIVEIYRDQYRSKFLLPVFQHDPNSGAELIQINFRCPNQSAISNVRFFVRFERDLTLNAGERGTNTVDYDEGTGRYHCQILLPLGLYQMPFGTDYSKLCLRKSIIAHEWLEAMYVVVNGHRPYPKTVEDDPAYLALQVQERVERVPALDEEGDWQEKQYHALKDLLLSEHTVLRMLKEEGLEGGKAGFQRRWIEELGKNNSRPFISNLAGRIHQKIFVAKKEVVKALENLL